MAPPRHLKLTHPRPPPSSYTESTSASASPPSPPAPAECDIPIPSVEHVDSADRTAEWVVHSTGSRANSPDIPPRLSGTSVFSENSAPAWESSESRGPSLSDNGIHRSSPSAAPIPSASNFDGEREIKREATEDDAWGANPQSPPPRRSSVSGPGEPDEPAPSLSTSASGPRVLCPASSGSKRSRDVEDDGAGERSSQRRRRSASPEHLSRRSSALPSGDRAGPAPSPSSSASGSGVLHPASSGGKRSRNVEDDGAGDRSPRRRRTASTDLPPRQPSASTSGRPSPPAPLSSSPASGSGSSGSNSSASERARAAGDIGAGQRSPHLRWSIGRGLPPRQPPPGVQTLRPGLPWNSIMEGMVEVAMEAYRPPEPAAGPSVPSPVVDPSVPEPVVDAAVPAVDAAAVDNPVPAPDRAEGRLLARMEAFLAKGRVLPRAERFSMYRSFESHLSREELILEFLIREHA